MSRARLLMALAVLAAAVGCRSRVATFEIVEGYVGWVTVEYDREGCPSVGDSLFVSKIEVGGDGTACSKHWRGAEALGYSRFFYVDDEGERVRELRRTGWGGGGEIWSEFSIPDRGLYYLFVGSEAEFKAAAGPPVRLGA